MLPDNNIKKVLINSTAASGKSANSIFGVNGALSLYEDATLEFIAYDQAHEDKNFTLNLSELAEADLRDIVGGVFSIKTKDGISYHLMIKGEYQARPLGTSYSNTTISPALQDASSAVAFASDASLALLLIEWKNMLTPLLNSSGVKILTRSWRTWALLVLGVVVAVLAVLFALVAFLP